jgi:hypothetical protein
LTFDLVGRAGATETVELDGSVAAALVSEAAQHADERGLGWRDGEMLLRPSDRLVDLIRRSQDVAVAGLDET